MHTVKLQYSESIVRVCLCKQKNNKLNITTTQQPHILIVRLYTHTSYDHTGNYTAQPYQHPW